MQVNTGVPAASRHSNHSSQERLGGGAQGVDSWGGGGLAALPGPAASAAQPQRQPTLLETLAMAKVCGMAPDGGLRKHSCSVSGDELRAASHSGRSDTGLTFAAHQPCASADFGFRRASLRGEPEAGGQAQAAWQSPFSVPAPQLKLEPELSLRLPLRAEQSDDNGSARGVPAVVTAAGSFPAASVPSGALRSVDHTGSDTSGQLDSAAAELKLGAPMGAKAGGPAAGCVSQHPVSLLPTSASHGSLSSGGDEGRSDGTVAHEGEAHSNGGLRSAGLPQGSQQVRPTARSAVDSCRWTQP